VRICATRGFFIFLIASNFIMVATVLLIENGKYNPSLILAYSIAKVFNVAIEDIFEIIDEEERV